MKPQHYLHSSWEKFDEWRVRCKTFCVVVKHWTVSEEDSIRFQEEYGPHRWVVYAFIYPDHKLFHVVSGEKNTSKLEDFPVHGGVTFFRRHWSSDGKSCASIEVGADYFHDGDDPFTRDEDGQGVFSDAEALVKWLNEYDAGQVKEVQ